MNKEQEKMWKIAEEFGTPAYVFDTGLLKQRAEEIGRIFGPAVTLCYSIKANPFLIPAMLEKVEKLEVCSPGELSICERLRDDPAFGLDTGRIVYSGVNKTKEDVIQALEDGCGIYTAESLLHVRYFEEAAGERDMTVPLLLRLNAGSQFGMSREDLFFALEQRAEYPHIRFEGIHYFVGTQRSNKELRQQKEELRMLKELFDEIEERFGLRLEKLEYGPGLPVPLFAKDDFSDTLAPARELAPYLRETAEWCSLTVEMGRFFATECGSYLTRVMDLKTVGDKRYCIVDGGINHVNYLGQIMGMKLPVIWHLRREEQPSEGCPAAECPDAEEKQEWALCGSLCTTNDDLVRSCPMASLMVGDLLVFRNIGAYSITEGLYLFLSRRLPRVLLKEGDEIRIARDFVESYEINLIKAGV